MKSDRVYLDHIIECIEWILRYTSEGKSAFFADRKTQSAVLRELQTLAESAQRLSSVSKEARPEVFWKGIAGFRNILVHDYLGISLGRVWEIVENDVPELRSAVEAILKEIKEDF